MRVAGLIVPGVEGMLDYGARFSPMLEYILSQAAKTQQLSCSRQAGSAAGSKTEYCTFFDTF